MCPCLIPECGTSSDELQGDNLLCFARVALALKDVACERTCDAVHQRHIFVGVLEVAGQQVEVERRGDDHASRVAG